MNIRWQINWWQVLVVITSGFVTGTIAAGQHIVNSQAELGVLLGPLISGALVSGVTAGLAMLTGKPPEQIAEDWINGEDEKG